MFCSKIDKMPSNHPGTYFLHLLVKYYHFWILCLLSSLSTLVLLACAIRRESWEVKFLNPWVSKKALILPPYFFSIFARRKMVFTQNVSALLGCLQEVIYVRLRSNACRVLFFPSLLVACFCSGKFWIISLACILKYHELGLVGVGLFHLSAQHSAHLRKWKSHTFLYLWKFCFIVLSKYHYHSPSCSSPKPWNQSPWTLPLPPTTCRPIDSTY